MTCRPFAIRLLPVLILFPVAVLAPGCTQNPNPTAERTWQTVFRELPSGLLSVSGTSPQDVYTVGTDSGDGLGPVLMHYNGSEWRRLNTGTTGDLWWITAVPIDGVFYLSGESGMILRFDPQIQSIEPQNTPSTETIFGVWGSASDNIWAVGGLLTDQQFGGTIWHFDGTSWLIQDLSQQFPDGFATVFKIWGRSPNEVYAVGAAGLILRFDGVAWTLVDDGTTRNATLFSVYGNEDTVVAVGGFNSAVIIEQRDDIFMDRATPETIQMNGVFVTTGGVGAAVGRELNVAFWTANGWEVAQDTGLPIDLDFHANWIDSESGLWAAGGVLIGDPINRGTLVYFGPQTVSSVVVEP
ncbi:MAG: hypothetical protein AABZ47_14025 [Planctomycetota bacterium]